jgi:hypothetical protein
VDRQRARHQEHRRPVQDAARRQRRRPHGADGTRWATQKAHANAAVTAPTLLAYDCDLDLSIGPLVRPVFKMQSGTGYWCVIEVWETTKAVRG